jgi:RNA polymerase sigma-70 factor, ECF subfamily
MLVGHDVMVARLPRFEPSPQASESPESSGVAPPSPSGFVNSGPPTAPTQESGTLTEQDSAARELGPTEQGQGALAAPAHEVPPFESIYRQYFDFVWSSTKRLGVSQAAMDDVVQEIFMVIHARLGTLQKPESLRSWIYGISRRTVSDHHRSRRTREASQVALARELEVGNELPRTPFDLTQQSDQVKLLWSLLEEMDWAKREVFLLAELDEMTAPEIAEALEIPLNTAYSRLRAARHAFDEKLARRAIRQGRGS